ncbi:Homeobox protein prospero, partial [Pseudolycoriella hygida]
MSKSYDSNVEPISHQPQFVLHCLNVSRPRRSYPIDDRPSLRQLSVKQLGQQQQQQSSIAAFNELRSENTELKRTLETLKADFEGFQISQLLKSDLNGHSPSNAHAAAVEKATVDLREEVAGLSNQLQKLREAQGAFLKRKIHKENSSNSEATRAVTVRQKYLMMATQMLDRKSPRTKVSERANNIQSGMPMHLNGPPLDNNTNINMPPHVRPSPTAAMFQAPKPPQGMNSVAAAALYNSMNVLGGHPNL